MRHQYLKIWPQLEMHLMTRDVKLEKLFCKPVTPNKETRRSTSRRRTFIVNKGKVMNCGGGGSCSTYIVEVIPPSKLSQVMDEKASICCVYSSEYCSADYTMNCILFVVGMSLIQASAILVFPLFCTSATVLERFCFFIDSGNAY